MSDDFAREQLAGLIALGPFRKCLIGRFGGDSADWMQILFTRMEREYASSEAGQVECIGALGRLALTELLRTDPYAMQAGTVRGGESSLLVRFLSLVEERLGKRWRIRDFAHELGSTPYLLNRACNATIGMKASEVVRARHVQEAKRLLQFTTLGMAEIGQALGFGDPAHFARSFRSATGTSPRNWRRLRSDGGLLDDYPGEQPGE